MVSQLSHDKSGLGFLAHLVGGVSSGEFAYVRFTTLSVHSLGIFLVENCACELIKVALI